MRAAAYRGYARHYGRNRRARHRNRGRAASAEPRRHDPDRNRRIERPPTPRGDHAIALDRFATPAAVARPGAVLGTAVGPIGVPGHPDHHFLYTFPTIAAPADLRLGFARQPPSLPPTRLVRAHAHTHT